MFEQSISKSQTVMGHVQSPNFDVCKTTYFAYVCKHWSFWNGYLLLLNIVAVNVLCEALPYVTIWDELLWKNINLSLKYQHCITCSNWFLTTELTELQRLYWYKDSWGTASFTSCFTNINCNRKHSSGTSIYNVLFLMRKSIFMHNMSMFQLILIL